MMHIKILVAAALAAGATTVASHADQASPETPAAIAADAEIAGKAANATFGDLMKQVLRAGDAGPGARAQRQAGAAGETNVDNTVTASIGSEVERAKSTPPYHAIVSRYASEYGVPVTLAHAIISVESNYRASARGSAGEIGLMQIKPSTARGVGYQGSAKALYAPETNIKFGMKYLAMAYELGGGDTCGAILRYNAGHAATRMNPISAAYCVKVKRILGR